MLLLSGCSREHLSTATSPPVLISNAPEVRFAVIGDYGLSGPESRAVSELVKSWEPDFIITTGDNNYPSGGASTIDGNIGRYYHGFIHPYRGDYGEGAEANRFFPSLGNHDWRWRAPGPYTDYFKLPGNERYYGFIWGPVQFFALDSAQKEPAGVTSGSAQALWLRGLLSSSDRPFRFVYMHHPPYSSGSHGPTGYMQWSFAEWGVDAVFSGHDHTYERLERGGVLYFVNGLGGNERYEFRSAPVGGSRFRYNAEYGAMLVEADETSASFMFYNIRGELVDEYELER
jgi:hypothetical protein